MSPTKEKAGTPVKSTKPAKAAPVKATAPAKDGVAAAARGRRRTMVGVVTSDKMDKTVVVAVTRRIRDERFHKFLTKRVKYKAHDPKNEFKVGDKVEISETRPLSKDKHFRVARLIERPVEV